MPVFMFALTDTVAQHLNMIESQCAANPIDDQHQWDGYQSTTE